MAELPRSFRSWLVVPSYHVLDEAELVTIVGLDTVSVGKPIQKLFDSSEIDPDFAVFPDSAAPLLRSPVSIPGG